MRVDNNKFRLSYIFSTFLLSISCQNIRDAKKLIVKCVDSKLSFMFSENQMKYFLVRCNLHLKVVLLLFLALCDFRNYKYYLICIIKKMRSICFRFKPKTCVQLFLLVTKLRNNILEYKNIWFNDYKQSSCGEIVGGWE